MDSQKKTWVVQILIYMCSIFTGDSVLVKKISARPYTTRNHAYIYIYAWKIHVKKKFTKQSLHKFNARNAAHITYRLFTRCALYSGFVCVYILIIIIINKIRNVHTRRMWDTCMGGKTMSKRIQRVVTAVDVYCRRSCCRRVTFISE